jgi:hypothetical protein
MASSVINDGGVASSRCVLFPCRAPISGIVVVGGLHLLQLCYLSWCALLDVDLERLSCCARLRDVFFVIFSCF